MEYMKTVVDPVLSTVLQGLFLSRPEDNIERSICRLVEQLASGFRPNLDGTTVNHAILKAYSVKVDVVLKVLS